MDTKFFKTEEYSDTLQYVYHKLVALQGSEEKLNKFLMENYQAYFKTSTDAEDCLYRDDFEGMLYWPLFFLTEEGYNKFILTHC